jgi:Tol biopolymer transport system component
MTTEALQLAGSWSPDGEWLAFVEQSPTTGRDVWLMGRSRERIPFANSPADESAPRFSPDGQWIAYVSNESGRAEVYVRRRSGPGARMVSVSGGSEPVWRPDGRAVYFRRDGRLLVAPLGGGDPRVVFDGATEPGTFDAAGYDVMRGTDRFLMITSTSADAAPSELRIILNWSPPLTSSR